MPQEKTVYVLGAGFSLVQNSGAPAQSEILRKIKSLSRNQIESLGDYKFTTYWENFNDQRSSLFDFLTKIFSCDVNAACNIELEDIFTLLDKTIHNHHYIRHYSDKDISDYRTKLNFCIVYTFSVLLYRPPTDFYNDLAIKIIEHKTRSNSDNLSFINLNWDLLIDNAIYYRCEANNSDIANPKIAIDYCFYTDPFEKSDQQHHIPHIKLKALGYNNIKVLKPHGSFNWLVCMNCGKVLIAFGDKIAFYEYVKEQKSCSYCDRTALKSVIKTPTIIKDFNNVHLGDVLHNMEIELLEASKIIFVGYSLPYADIELRYILKRCIRENAEVTSILLKNDRNVLEYNETRKRYQKFFGSQLKTTEFDELGTELFFRSQFSF